MSKLAIVFDTNILRGSIDAPDRWNEFYLQRYEETEKFIETNDLIDNVEILLPEVVIEELKRYKRDKLKNRLAKLKQFQEEFNDMPSVKIEFEEIHYKNYIDSLLKSSAESGCETIFNQIPIPNNREMLFDKIFKAALDKHPPFKKGDSDQGFKDALIFASMLEFAKSNDKYDEYIFYTNDKGFEKPEKMQNFFAKYTSKELKIHREATPVLFLKNKFGLKSPIDDYLDDDFYSYYKYDMDTYDEIYIVSLNKFVQINNVELDNQESTYYEEDGVYFMTLVFIVDCGNVAGVEVTPKVEVSVELKQIDGEWIHKKKKCSAELR